MPNFLGEIQTACRGLRRDARYTCTTALVLSLGIACNTAVFSVVNKVLLEPLPYPEPDRLVQLVTVSELGNQSLVSIPKYLTWRDHTHSFDAIAAYDLGVPNVLLADNATPLTLAAARVSADYFGLFGAAVQLGHTFDRKANDHGTQHVLVIGNEVWKSRFHSDPTIVDRTISLDHEPWRVVGVLAPEFKPPAKVDVWLPLEEDPATEDHMNRVQVAARLAPGVTLDMAIRDVANSKMPFVGRYPNAPLLFGEQFFPMPMRDALVGNVRPALLLLSGAVGCLLLIASVNVAGLGLARAARRVNESAVCVALGAEAGRLIRQMLTESLVLSSGAALLGLLAGCGAIRGLLALSPADLPRVGANGAEISLDGRVFLFTMLVALASGFCSGILPALTARRVDVMILINSHQPESGAGFRRGGKLAILVLSQVALALVLLSAGGMLLRTFVGSRTANHGFSEEHVLTIRMPLSGPAFAHTDQTAEFIRRTEDRMKRTSGIVAVAATSSLPLEPSLTMPFTITRHDQTKVGLYHGTATWRSVTPDFFTAIQIRILRGRVIDRSDGQHAAGVVVISNRMMKKFWQEIGSDPIGEYIVIGKGMRPELRDIPRQIIGVVDDIQEGGMSREPMMYVPVSQVVDGMTAWSHAVRPLTWLIRTSGDDVSQSLVEHALRQAAGLPLGPVSTMRQVMAASFARAQFYLMLLTVFGLVAFVLAAVGLYGLISYTVDHRKREIAVRMAVGAAENNIRNLVVWQGMRLALLGVGIGLPASLAASRVVVSTIFGARPWDFAVLGGVALLLTLVSLAASYLPAIRAGRVNPAELLKL